MKQDKIANQRMSGCDMAAEREKNKSGLYHFHWIRGSAAAFYFIQGIGM